MGKLVLGLDIGVTSVGYGIVDIEKGVFVDYGVRLFKEGTAQNNLERRTRRGSRRLVRRRTNRIQDMKKLLEINGIKDDHYQHLDNPYELRVKGLTQQLNNEELTCALLHLTKRRGSSLETVEDDDDGVTKKILADNKKLLGKNNFVCEVQLARLNETGKIRGNVNNFKTSDYFKEAIQILNNQELDTELKDNIIEIITRKRAYYEGPGSRKSPSDYGRFIKVDSQIQEIDLIEKMRGKCSLFPEELRAPKYSYAAEYFNVLNDLNNLSILGAKLSVEQKNDLLLYIEKNMGITPKQIAKILEVEESSISGFRINKSGGAIFTEMKGFKTVGKIFKQHQKIELIDDKVIIDEIMDVVTQTKGIEERETKILSMRPELPLDLVADLARIKGVTGYHSLGYKALRLINKEMLESDMNQMQVIHQLEMFDKYRPSQKGKKDIVFDENAVLSPVAIRAHKEALKLVNHLRKTYGEFDSIVIETTRDKNTAEQKKRINDTQKYFENRNKDVDSLLKERGLNPDLVNGKTKLKIKLYMEQDGKTIYTQSPIDLNRLINDPNLYEIEHILPISISLDDSLSNKALASRMENQLKGNLAPLDAFAKGRFAKINGDVERYRKYVLSNHNYRSKELRKKRDYLLHDEDLNKYENAKEFIARNLVDTSYACRVVLNTLQNYFKDNEIPTTVHTVKGKFTGMFRKRINMNKERDADYLHHAIDALIVASIKKIPIVSTYFRKFELTDIYDESTGEILNVENSDAVLNGQYISFISTLKNIYDESSKYYNGLMDRSNMSYAPIKISHKIDTKPNRQHFDETIYSTRTINGQEMLTETYRDIYDPKFTKLTDDIINRAAQSKYIMANKDPESFKQIEMIIMNHFETYKDDSKYYTFDKKKEVYKLKGENPLTAYQQEFGKVRKYAKKGNGPEITKIRFYSEKLGNHVDISHKYQTHNKKVIVKQISPYRTDIYQSPEGKYNFITIRYKDVRYVETKGKYVINRDWYHEQKNQKGIAEEWQFVCSLHRDELLAVKKKPGDKFIYDSSTEGEGQTRYHDGVAPEILKFTATNNDNKGILEFKPIYSYCKKQLMVSIGPIKSIEKFSTNVAGQMYKVTNNVLKFEFE